MPEPTPNPDADGLVGAIIPYAGESLPGPKYRWCHGTQEVSRTEFSLCFSRLGERWGAGDGSTTFNLPNLNKQFLVGFDESDTSYDEVGGSVGSPTGAISGSVSGGTVSGTTGGPSDTSTANQAAPATGTFATAGHSHSFSGSLSGASISGTAATIPPAKVVRYIIKIS